jgi:hypothetical protein
MRDPRASERAGIEGEAVIEELVGSVQMHPH